jgi:hypothetical protein
MSQRATGTKDEDPSVSPCVAPSEKGETSRPRTWVSWGDGETRSVSDVLRNVEARGVGPHRETCPD